MPFAKINTTGFKVEIVNIIKRFGLAGQFLPLMRQDCNSITPLSRPVQFYPLNFFAF